jgi:hypothetical protein
MLSSVSATPMRLVLRLFFAVVATLLCIESAPAQTVRITSAIDPAKRASLASGPPAGRAGAHDLGRVPAAFPLRLTLRFVPSADQKSELRRLLAELQSPRSALHRQWLTPEQYADRFGLSPADVRQIETWLTASGF